MHLRRLGARRHRSAVSLSSLRMAGDKTAAARVAAPEMADHEVGAQDGSFRRHHGVGADRTVWQDRDRGGFGGLAYGSGRGHDGSLGWPQISDTAEIVYRTSMLSGRATWRVASGRCHLPAQGAISKKKAGISSAALPQLTDACPLRPRGAFPAGAKISCLEKFAAEYFLRRALPEHSCLISRRRRLRPDFRLASARKLTLITPAAGPARRVAIRCRYREGVCHGRFVLIAGSASCGAWPGF